MWRHRKGKTQGRPWLGPSRTTHGPGLVSAGTVLVLGIVLRSGAKEYEYSLQVIM